MFAAANVVQVVFLQVAGNCDVHGSLPVFYEVKLASYLFLLFLLIFRTWGKFKELDSVY